MKEKKHKEYINCAQGKVIKVSLICRRKSKEVLKDKKKEKNCIYIVYSQTNAHIFVVIITSNPGET